MCLLVNFLSSYHVVYVLPLLLSWQKKKRLSHLSPPTKMCPKQMCYFEPGRLWCGDQGGNCLMWLCMGRVGGWTYKPWVCFFFRCWTLGLENLGVYFHVVLMMNLIERHQNPLLKAHIYGTKWQWCRKDRVNSALLTVLLTLWLLLGVPCWILYAKCLVCYLTCCEVYRTLPFGKIVVERNTCWTCF